MEQIPFSPDELTVTGTYPTNGVENPKTLRLSTPITPRENMRRFIAGEKPLWIPGYETIRIHPEIVPDNVARGSVLEAVPMPELGGPDLFGIPWLYQAENLGGSAVLPGSAIMSDANDWPKAVRFPDVSSWDWEGAAKRNAEYLRSDVPVWTVQFSGLWERLISLMDFENAAIALIDETQKEAVKSLFSSLTDTYIDILQHCIDYFHITGYMFHDDWGFMQGPLFSRETWVEMIAPYIRRLTDYCHAHGVIYEQHSCGKLDSMIDLICSVGIDMWFPQTINDLDKMYRDYGDKIHLGIRPELPFDASEEEQIRKAEEIVSRFHEPGKYIYTTGYGCPIYHKTLYELSRKLYLQ